MKIKNFSSLHLRTGLQAGITCDENSTNCIATDQNGNHHPEIWDNCNHWKPFAGESCAWKVGPTKIKEGWSCQEC